MSTLLDDIDAFLLRTGISQGRFGLKAANNGRLVARLREGRRVWPETEEKIRVFMAQYGEDDCRAPNERTAA